MGKAAPDEVLDAMFDRIIDEADTLYVCSDEPADFAGIESVALAEVALDSGDFTKGNGDVSGRKVTVGQQSNVPIDTSGSADHIVLAKANSQSPKLLYVTTCTEQALTSGGTVTVPAWDIEIADPT
jgi:hypothetical protein